MLMQILINLFRVICPDRELFLIIILIIIQEKQANAEASREFLKTILFFLATVFLTSKYHPSSGIYACGYVPKSSPGKAKYLVGPGESNRKNWNQNFPQLFFSKNTKEWSLNIVKACAPCVGKHHLKTMKGKNSSHSMLSHSTLNHTHASFPLCQPEVSVDYGKAIGASVVISIVFYSILVLPHNTNSQKESVSILIQSVL